MKAIILPVLYLAAEAISVVPERVMMLVLHVYINQL
ncbi:hypothetical protein SAMN05720354_1281 [Nitrosospira sp. Nsp1]|nr:hypothetical protein SAMN05720354_1281 [Nitrosospira sp. Nsp1]